MKIGYMHIFNSAQYLQAYNKTYFMLKVRHGR